MRIIVTKSYDAMSMTAAKIIAGQIYLKPNSTLGLATGSTPLLMYKKLIDIHKSIGLDFSAVTSFNLDEYIGISPENPESYHYFMYNNFFKYINIMPKNIYIPDGMAADINKECHDYDQLIKNNGGIDLQVLGIGKNAHIGFNEPDIKFETTTHKVKLDDETIEANSRFFADAKQVPRYAISMGIKTIMFAKKIILLANGKNKAEAVFKAVTGKISPAAPASILQLHQDVIVIVDKEAGAMLPHVEN
ncbi:glucosamine-6-phosphate deaminase [Pectinatus frisingensis]|jgi:glucosamine-6-phosphate deaminase|uniref:glucosamine-6-phosphate deaminase n=1 Tax=Pectinatus frisingensis TaxID=865 RepID=UPI0015F4730C|nr:glucosamine-6-phosphate deaminase [Pectinatus frisingensis]